jgi:hypothetical protein
MRADRYDRSAPRFVLVEAVDYHDEYGSFAARISLRMVEGPMLSSVLATPDGFAVHPSSFNFAMVRPGSDLTLVVTCDNGYVDSQVSVDLDCVEAGGEQRRWRQGLSATIVSPPAPASGLFDQPWTR